MTRNRDAVKFTAGREGLPKRDAPSYCQPRLLVGDLQETSTRIERAAAERRTPLRAGGRGGAPPPEFLPGELLSEHLRLKTSTLLIPQESFRNSFDKW